MSSRGLLRPLRGSGFALGQPDRLRRQAHLELRLADIAARERTERGGSHGRDDLLHGFAPFLFFELAGHRAGTSPALAP